MTPDEKTVRYRMAHKFDIDYARPLNNCVRVYAKDMPVTPEVVMRWVHQCGCQYARHGWDGVGGNYVDVRGVV